MGNKETYIVLVLIGFQTIAKAGMDKFNIFTNGCWVQMLSKGARVRCRMKACPLLILYTILVYVCDVVYEVMEWTLFLYVQIFSVWKEAMKMDYLPVISSSWKMRETSKGPLRLTLKTAKLEVVLFLLTTCIKHFMIDV